MTLPRPAAFFLFFSLAAGATAGSAPRKLAPKRPPASGGWQVQSFPTVRACTNAVVTHRLAHSGRSSLAVTVRLDGALAARRQGEVYVDLRYHPPAGATAPVDLAGQTVSAWIYAPASLYGPARNPNGIRIFVKDSQWHSEYGTWTHLSPGRWARITLSPIPTTPKFGYRDADFDPHQIILIGVSIATGRDSLTHSNGEMLVDDVRWGTGTAPEYGFE